MYTKQTLSASHLVRDVVGYDDNLPAVRVLRRDHGDLPRHHADGVHARGPERLYDFGVSGRCVHRATQRTGLVRHEGGAAR